MTAAGRLFESGGGAAALFGRRECLLMHTPVADMPEQMDGGAANACRIGADATWKGKSKPLYQAKIISNEKKRKRDGQTHLYLLDPLQRLLDRQVLVPLLFLRRHGPIVWDVTGVAAGR